MAFWLPVGLVGAVLAGFTLQARRRRRKLLAHLRAEWGRPTERTRDISEIAHYHRIFAADHEFPLDVRTGEDLDLDAVFAALDRTESSVGQQLLYHRLRTTPDSEDRAAFEALTTRLAEDARSRERIQAALSRLRGHPGKSTFLRTVGVNVILAQTVNTCLATCYRAPVFRVRSVIGRGDDLTAGRSYYRDEVEAVLSLVLASRSTRLHPPSPLPVRRALPRHQHGRTHCGGRGDPCRAHRR